MKYTTSCSPSEFKQLSCSCNHYDAYFDEKDSSYITYVAAYSDATLIGFISCLTPDFSIMDNQSIYFVEITAMTHPDYRHQKIFSNLLLKLDSIIKKQSNRFNKKHHTSISVQFICSVNDEKAKKYHLALYSSEYLMILSDIHMFHKQKTMNAHANQQEKYHSSFNDDNRCYMLFGDNNSSPIAVCELEYMSSYTCISNVYVDNDKRGKKVGTCLLTRLIQDYFNKNHKKQPLILHVSSTNPAAFQLYKNCGFSICEQVNYYCINTVLE